MRILLCLLVASPTLAAVLGIVSGVYVVKWGNSFWGLIPLLGAAFSIGIASAASLIVHDELTRRRASHD